MAEWRRNGLKIHRPQKRAGSSPACGTITIIKVDPFGSEENYDKVDCCSR